MKKNYIAYIIVLMSVALLGLIGLQFYWLNITVGANEEKFKTEVRDALNDVVEHLEMRDAVYVTQKQIGDGVAIVHDSATVNVDSAGNVRWQEEKLIRSRQLVGTDRLAAEGYVYEIEEEMLITKSGIARKNPIADLEASDVRLFDGTISPFLRQDTSVERKNFQNGQHFQVMRYSDMVSSIVNELVNAGKGKNIEDRLSMDLLDTLIGTALTDRGVKSDYLFGLRQMDQENSKLLFTNAPEDKVEEVLEKGFNVRLFPTSPFGNRSMLYVHIPESGDFVYGRMSFVLYSSVVFLSMAIVCFGYAIRVIFRQKRISDITNDFISNMTHELKTPIATVSLTTEALLDPDIRSVPSLLDRYLNVIKEENNRLGKQVEKVLQIARLEKGDLKLSITELDLHQIIDKAINNINIQIESRGGVLKKELMAQTSVLEADKLHLTNIIYNLLDNANKYSPDVPHILIRTENVPKGIQIQVSDRGQGIPKDMQNKIFDKFYRVPTGDVHDVKGFGLGLSYVKKIVDTHKGSISVRSELGKGSTFTIILPHHLAQE